VVGQLAAAHLQTVIWLLLSARSDVRARMLCSVCCVLLCVVVSALQLFFKRSTLYVPFVLVGAFYANEVRCFTRAQGCWCCFSVLRQCSSAGGFICTHVLPAAAAALCVPTTPQAVDALVGGIWESRNQGKLFHHMEIPAAEE
jgi:hypothetical protein